MKKITIGFIALSLTFFFALLYETIGWYQYLGNLEKAIQRANLAQTTGAIFFFFVIPTTISIIILEWKKCEKLFIYILSSIVPVWIILLVLNVFIPFLYNLEPIEQSYQMAPQVYIEPDYFLLLMTDITRSIVVCPLYISVYFFLRKRSIKT